MQSILYKTSFFIYFLLFLPVFLVAQVQGLWVVEKVTVGDRVMTPVAKWVRLDADGTQFSGNGWLQHTSGTWHLNAQTSELSFTSEPGPEDDFGAFKINYDAQHMTWERMEEGEKVFVELERTDALPQSPSDQIQGLWDLEKVVNKNKDITNQYDPNDKMYVFMRWDRVVVKRTATGERTYGIWQMNAHQPELQLLNCDTGNKNEKWRVAFSAATMTWTGMDEDNKDLILTYHKIKVFPK